MLEGAFIYSFNWLLEILKQENSSGGRNGGDNKNVSPTQR
jgi:hypothetical protein